VVAFNVYDRIGLEPIPIRQSPAPRGRESLRMKNVSKHSRQENSWTHCVLNKHNSYDGPVREVYSMSVIW
jgi:hypothetical protein